MICPKFFKRKFFLRLVLPTGLLVVLLAALAFAVVLIGWTRYARALSPLDPWHRDHPPSEFTHADEDPGFDFDDYLAKEERVFEELEDLVRGAWERADGDPFCRFNPASVCHPGRDGAVNWNRSRIREASEPRGGVLMLHGLSDSPYAFRRLSERLHREGHTVMLLRVPGHGTCPGALAEVDWRDWTAAVRVAARDLRRRLPKEAPMIVAGFSNGGALTVNLVIEALEDDGLPVPDALVLISPMIGITPLAEITRFHGLIAAVSGDERAHWSSVNAAIDPYKYTSWPMNASIQAFRMAGRVESGLARLSKTGRMVEFPRVLTCVSAVDATVRMSDLVDGLYGRVENPQSEVIIFDVNRASWTRNLIKDRYENAFTPLVEGKTKPYGITLMSNRWTGTPALRERRRDASGTRERDPGLSWPAGLFSLAHAALPFPPDDPLYGSDPDRNLPLPLGDLNLRGESGVLRITDGQILRLRHNPFYDYMEDRIVTWLAVER